eukprot:360158-Chlamydomonas_euryale.AAC.5
MLGCSRLLAAALSTAVGSGEAPTATTDHIQVQHVRCMYVRCMNNTWNIRYHRPIRTKPAQIAGVYAINMPRVQIAVCANPHRRSLDGRTLRSFFQSAATWMPRCVPTRRQSASCRQSSRCSLRPTGGDFCAKEQG